MAGEDIIRILEKLDTMTSRVMALEFKVIAMAESNSRRNEEVAELRKSNSTLKLVVVGLACALIGAGVGNIPTIAKLIGAF